MKPTGARPPEKKGVTSWTHVDAKENEKWTGWIAGPHCGVVSHYCSRTIPCLKEYLGKKIPCEGCSKPLPREFVYYVPLYRCSDSRPVVVVVHDDQADTLAMVKMHEQVVIGRTDNKFEGLYVQRLFKQLEFQTTLESKRQPARIEEFLPTLWKMRGTIDAATITRGPLVEEAPQLLGDELPAKKLSPEKTVELSAAVVSQQFVVAGEDGPKPLEGDVAEVYDRIKNRIQPSKNGKH